MKHPSIGVPLFEGVHSVDRRAGASTAGSAARTDRGCQKTRTDKTRNVTTQDAVRQFEAIFISSSFQSKGLTATLSGRGRASRARGPLKRDVRRPPPPATIRSRLEVNSLPSRA